jgi:alpha-beta hydrolase superfamily lysophospholipase
MNAEQLTGDPELQRAYLADPLVGRGISVALYDGVLEAQRLSFEEGLDHQVPALILLPMADLVVDRAASEAWAERLGGDARVLRLPGTRHEPHNDVRREEVYRLIADWLDDRTHGGGPG